MQNVIYRPTEEEMREVAFPYMVSLGKGDIAKMLADLNWEAWYGLPTEDYQFEPALTRDRKPALVSRGDRHYIWVLPRAKLALESGPRTPLLALGNRLRNMASFVSVDVLPVGRSVQDAISYARDLNHAAWRRSFENMKKPKLLRPPPTQSAPEPAIALSKA